MSIYLPVELSMIFLFLVLLPELFVCVYPELLLCESWARVVVEGCS